MNRKVIGIIGGGQLGMYLAIAAHNLGYDSAIYNDKEDCSAANIAKYFMSGSFNDEVKLRDFCSLCDVITYEFENIDNNLISLLAKDYNIPQGVKPLIIASNRLNERAMATELGINQGNYYLKDQIYKLNLEEHDYIFKSTTLGYDGKNQFLVSDVVDLDKINYELDYVIEEKIEFDYEMSLIAIKSINGEFKVYPPFINTHHKGILHISEQDEGVSDNVYQQAYNAIEKIMTSYDMVGILCCEFFVMDDVVYFNEIAPRPHNSGHITMDLNITSQYENHIRAITNMKLGATDLINNHAFMVNILGQDITKVENLLNSNDKIKVYDYHKEPRYNRKVGHLICFDYDLYDYFNMKWRNE